MAVLGPSGCGKTTTLMMLAGIYQPTSGDITFDGARVNDVEARGRNVGIVFQSYALYPNMSVLENIMFPLRFKTIERREAERRAREIAALVRVDGLLDRRPSQLSGGQQQRVALARALVKRPHLLLLDEPLSNLDAGLRLTMRTEIRRIQRELGVTTILVTHDQIEATTMADRVVVMNGGRVEQEGAAEDLYERPDTLFVASFIGSPPINLFDGTADGSVLKRARGRASRWRNRCAARSSWGFGRRACRWWMAGCLRASPPPSRWAGRCSTRPTVTSGSFVFSRPARNPAIAKATTCRSASLPRARSSSTRRAAAGSMCGLRLDLQYGHASTDQGSDRNCRQLSEAALCLQAKRSIIARQLWLCFRPAPTRTRASRICKTAGQGSAFGYRRPKPGRHRHHDRR